MVPNSVHTCGLASSSGYVSSDEELTSSADVAVRSWESLVACPGLLACHSFEFSLISGSWRSCMSARPLNSSPSGGGQVS